MSSSQSRYDLRLRQAPKGEGHLIGQEREPVLVIDEVMETPLGLIDYASHEVSFAPVWGEGGGYPGMRAPAPLPYVGALIKAVDPLLRETYRLRDVKLARAHCTFSLVTLPPDRLAPLQRIPHVDTVDPLQFALLHYLCDESFGGTAFYRHEATGFETLDAERRTIYEGQRADELAGTPPPGEYIARDTPHYRQTACFDARLDRLLVYRSRVFHSGRILAPERLTDDPRLGRLTANIFVNYRPA